MKAKKFVAVYPYGEEISYFIPEMSDEEAINGALFDELCTPEIKCLGIVDVPDNWIEVAGELMSEETLSARMTEEFSNICPGNYR